MKWMAAAASDAHELAGCSGVVGGGGGWRSLNSELYNCCVPSERGGVPSKWEKLDGGGRVFVLAVEFYSGTEGKEYSTYRINRKLLGGNVYVTVL